MAQLEINRPVLQSLHIVSKVIKSNYNSALIGVGFHIIGNQVHTGIEHYHMPHLRIGSEKVRQSRTDVLGIVRIHENRMNNALLAEFLMDKIRETAPPVRRRV